MKATVFCPTSAALRGARRRRCPGQGHWRWSARPRQGPRQSARRSGCPWESGCGCQRSPAQVRSADRGGRGHRAASADPGICSSAADTRRRRGRRDAGRQCSTRPGPVQRRRDCRYRAAGARPVTDDAGRALRPAAKIASGSPKASSKLALRLAANTRNQRQSQPGGQRLALAHLGRADEVVDFDRPFGLHDQAVGNTFEGTEDEEQADTRGRNRRSRPCGRARRVRRPSDCAREPGRGRSRCRRLPPRLIATIDPRPAASTPP
jgi:hypothetical protein